MTTLLTEYRIVFLGLSLLSLLFFLGSLLALPWFVGKLPEDYFVNPGKDTERSIPLIILKNGLGAVAFLAGVVMLFIPGQGLLTMVAGLVIMDFPGKVKCINYFSGLPRVRAGLNWLRRIKGQPPLIFPESREE